MTAITPTIAQRRMANGFGSARRKAANLMPVPLIRELQSLSLAGLSERF
jgi:hypothetical protein